jgi:hypothetical protein
MYSSLMFHPSSVIDVQASSPGHQREGGRTLNATLQKQTLLLLHYLGFQDAITHVQTLERIANLPRLYHDHASGLPLVATQPAAAASNKTPPLLCSLIILSTSLQQSALIKGKPTHICSSVHTMAALILCTIDTTAPVTHDSIPSYLLHA